MDKRLLVITYAVTEELDIEKVKEAIEQSENAPTAGLSRLGRLKLKLNKKFSDTETILVETGIGKVDSYEGLSQTIDYAVDHFGKGTQVTVLNLGTAASISAKTGTVCECNRFIERDLIRIGYGSKDDYTIYLKNQTPEFGADGPDWGHYSSLYSCNSGDSFVTNPDEAHQMRDGWTAVCDMEGFSQARVIAEHEGTFDHPIRFYCTKYITDKIDGENSIDAWEEELPAARSELTRYAVEFIRRFYTEKI